MFDYQVHVDAELGELLSDERIGEKVGVRISQLVLLHLAYV